jgi:6-methylsalicylate decarboxylase
LLDVLAERDLPLFIHPGPAAGAGTAGPAWWAALVPYVQQLHAAWFAFRAYGRPAYPRLRVCFTALAGLGPLHGERLAARGGASPLARGVIDRDMFAETSSYGGRTIDSVLRVLGVDMLVFGSDRPYAQPCRDPGLGDAACHAIRVTNPARLLHGDRPLPGGRDLTVQRTGEE